MGYAIEKGSPLGSVFSIKYNVTYKRLPGLMAMAWINLIIMDFT